MKNRVITRSFSIEPELLDQAQHLARLRGYRYSFSAWVSDLIRKELDCLQNEKRLQVPSNRLQ
jgi:hypothetical protein